MRKFVIAAALAASALTAAAPAAAQYYPQPQGYGNGYNNNWGQVRRLQVRVDQLQRQISRLDSRDVLSEREAARLRNESRNLEQRLRYAARGTLTPWEAQDIERRIYRLEARIQREARDGNGWRSGDRWGQNDGRYRDGRFIDRDRDGRDDRHEDDRGYDHD